MLLLNRADPYGAPGMEYSKIPNVLQDIKRALKNAIRIDIMMRMSFKSCDKNRIWAENRIYIVEGVLELKIKEESKENLSL